MISLQLLSRNLKRLTLLRGFASSPVVTKKPNLDEKPSKSRKANENLTKNIKKHIFSGEISKKLPTSDSNENQSDQKINSIKSNDDDKLAKEIGELDSVPKLLEISEKHFDKKTGIRILSRLSLLTATNKARPNEFENDFRFMKICGLLAKVSERKEITSTPKDLPKSTELETILSVACDDEAIQLIQTLPLSQKSRVFSSLAKKKTRSPVVLKALSQSISLSKNVLSLKECSDILFAMILLNFNDETLLSRTSVDICRGLAENNDKTAAIGSIITSMGHLKYKNPTLLDALSEWIVVKNELCRPKDLNSFILTLALVNYRPANFDVLKTKIFPKITVDNVTVTEWLDYVWASTVLEVYQESQLESVLKPEFETALVAGSFDGTLNPAHKLKLLNVNAVAKYLTSDYKGPTIDSNSNINNVKHIYRKSKQVLVNGLVDTLKNLFTDQSYVRIEHNTGMGVFIDAECVLNEKRLPLAIDSDNKDAFKIAFMIFDFHDLCKGKTNDPNGYNTLAIKLLTKNGYRVLNIPHNEFSTSDKLLKRVQYLDTKLKEIVKTK